MTDHTTPMFDDMDDVDLIVTYLQRRPPPDRAEAVRKRLEEDDAFRRFAAPLPLTWSVPPHLERHPRPEGEAERAWEEFVHERDVHACVRVEGNTNDDGSANGHSTLRKARTFREADGHRFVRWAESAESQLIHSGRTRK